MSEVPVNPGTPEPPQSPASVPPAYQPVAPAYPGSPMAAQPFAPPVKSGGSSALKIILIIVGVFAFLVVLVVAVIGYGVYKVRKAMHVNSSTGAVSMSMPGMSMNTDPGMKFTADELGTDIYPGAEQAKDGNMRMNMGGSTVVAASFMTSDPKEKVVDFYKSKLTGETAVMDFAGSAILTAKKSAQDQVSVTIGERSNSAGKTEIRIQHTTVTQSK